MRIKRIALVGSGLIGSSWATLFAVHGYDVIMEDLSEGILSQARDRMLAHVRFLIRKGFAESVSEDDILKRVVTTTDLEDAVANADYVQESVFEDEDLKRKIFRKIDANAPPHAIIASSTSGLLISRLQGELSRPERSMVVHPWNPPHIMPLVEIVPGSRTSKRFVKDTMELMKKLGRITILLKKEVPGHVGNRLAAALWREAVDLVDKGVASVEDVDLCVTKGFGLRWSVIGPHLAYHLGGGEGGIKKFIERLVPAFSTWWRSLETWTSLSESAQGKLITGLEEYSSLRKMGRKRLEIWRDERLVRVMKVLSEDPR